MPRHRDTTATKRRNETPRHTPPERLPERDPESQYERPVAQAEDRDVGREPGPEQIAWPALALGIGDDVDAVHLDLQRVRSGRAARNGNSGILNISHGQDSLLSLVPNRLALAPVDRAVGAIDETGPGRGK